jgi:hypothetical protein
MNATEVQRISEFVKSLTPATFGVTIITRTIPNMRVTGNPYVGRLFKLTRLTNVALRYNFRNTIANRLERAGKECEYEVEKPSGRSWVVNNLILCADKDPNQFYLRTTRRANTKANVLWELDGKIVTDQQTIDHIESFIPARKPSQKQLNAGLTEENEVVVNDYKFESLQYIEQGARKLQVAQ